MRLKSPGTVRSNGEALPPNAKTERPKQHLPAPRGE